MVLYFRNMHIVRRISALFLFLCALTASLWPIVLPKFAVADYAADYASQFAVDSFKDYGSATFQRAPNWGGLLGPDYLDTRVDLGDNPVITLQDGSVHLNGVLLTDEMGTPFGEEDLFLAFEFATSWDFGWVTLAGEPYSRFSIPVYEVNKIGHASALQYDPVLFAQFIDLDYALIDQQLNAGLPPARSWHIDPGVVTLTSAEGAYKLDVAYTLRLYEELGGAELETGGYTGEDYANDLREHQDFAQSFSRYDRLNGLAALLRYAGGIENREDYDRVMNGGHEEINRIIKDHIMYEFEPRRPLPEMMTPIIPNPRYRDAVRHSGAAEKLLKSVLSAEDEESLQKRLTKFRLAVGT